MGVTPLFYRFLVEMGPFQKARMGGSSGERLDSTDFNNGKVNEDNTSRVREPSMKKRKY